MTPPFYADKTVQKVLAEMVDRHCTVEALCNDDAATDCLTKCYNEKWLAKEDRDSSRGKHTWLHPPPGLERIALLHNLRQKREDPPTTTACIVLPTSKGRQQPWTNLLKGMEAVSQTGKEKS